MRITIDEALEHEWVREGGTAPNKSVHTRLYDGLRMIHNVCLRTRAPFFYFPFFLSLHLFVLKGAEAVRMWVVPPPSPPLPFSSRPLPETVRAISLQPITYHTGPVFVQVAPAIPIVGRQHACACMLCGGVVMFVRSARVLVCV